MTLTKSEYMILDAAAYEPVIRLTLIVSPYSAPWFPQHDLSNSQLIDLLLGLQDRKYIVAHATEPFFRDQFPDELYRPPPERVLLFADQFDLESWPIISLTSKVIEEELNLGRRLGEYRKRHKGIIPPANFRRENRYSYHLTSAGGAAWEEMVQADWSKYYTWRCVRLNNADLAPEQSLSYGRFGATALEILEAFFDWRLRWDNNINPNAELKCFTRWQSERVTSWKPLYWKTLPEGYQCDFLEYDVKYRGDENDRKTSSFQKFSVKQSWKEHADLFRWHKKLWK